MAQELITKSEILELLERYDIGKKPLSALLGFGATTILRYLDGVAPSEPFARALREIYDSPQAYLRILNDNREKITMVAYEKSKKAVLSARKLSNSISCALFLQKTHPGRYSAYETVMILFYAQAISQSLFKADLYQEDCLLSQNGETPYSQVFDTLCKGENIRQWNSFEEPEEKEKQLLLQTADLISEYGPKELQRMFEAERPYLRKSKREDGRKVIKNTAISAYFEKVTEGYRIAEPTDFKSYFDVRCGRKKRIPPRKN